MVKRKKLIKPTKEKVPKHTDPAQCLTKMLEQNKRKERDSGEQRRTKERSKGEAAKRRRSRKKNKNKN